MKKTTLKTKLPLGKETITTLMNAELARVVGGQETQPYSKQVCPVGVGDPG